MEPVDLGPFVNGMNNRRPAFALKDPGSDVIAELRQAVNVDITAQGSVKRRAGFTLQQAGVNCRSGWSNGARAFYAIGRRLYEFDGNTSTELRDDLPGNAQLAFDDSPVGILYSDGRRIHRIADTDAPAQPDAPLIAPTGPLRACYSFEMTGGSETAASAVNELGAGLVGAWTVSGLPTAFPAGVAALNIYADDGTGELFHVARLTAAAGSVTVDTTTLGRVCRVRERIDLPAGRYLRSSSGRLYSAVGNVLYQSDAFNHLICDPTRGFFLFKADITMLESQTAGLYVATEHETWWLPAGEQQIARVAPYGAVHGTGGASPVEEKCWWWSQGRGLVVATAGQIDTPIAERIEAGTAGFGASMHRRQDGMSHTVTALFNQVSGAAASSFMDAEIIRRGVQA